MNRSLCAGLILLIVSSTLPHRTSAQVNNVAVLPRPVTLNPGEGSFTLRPDTKIISDEDNKKTGMLLKGWLAPATGYSLKVAQAEDADNTISLKLDGSLTRLGEEGYLLEVTPQRVRIRAPHESGAFYGVQTLRLLLPTAIFSSSRKPDMDWRVPAVRIEDAPRFRWRGAMLDVSRHFMPKDFVLQFIDLLALHKLNVFHWHLTDDQGWRIEIKKYPRLTQVGAWRKETRLGHERRSPHGFDKQPHGGFYTQREVREVVEYASQRHITVVPEIEMPGHAQAFRPIKAPQTK